MPRVEKCRYQAAIFDLDGTLADSMRVWDNPCADWLISKGKIPGEGLNKKLAEMTITQAAEYVIEAYGITSEPSRILHEWQDAILLKYERDVMLKDGAAELLAHLADGGIKLAIATSTFPAACESVLARHGIRGYFSAIVYSDSVERNKTFPDIFLTCAEQLQTEPKHCVVFEDMYAALSGIRAAGMGAVAVYDNSGAATWERFKREADYAVVSLSECWRIIFNNT
ncbi:MAG: HAD family phosphatase [Treponema sp.]|nr:HAD family phosphatase [Treponema sp.]